MSVFLKNKKLGISNLEQNEIQNLIISNAGKPAEAIGPINFINGKYIKKETKISGKISFEKNIEINGFIYKTVITWNKNFECWIISFLGGPQYTHPNDAEPIQIGNYTIEAGDVINVPAYQYISFSDTETPDLAQNWTRSFVYGTLTIPKITIQEKYSNLRYLETPSEESQVYDLKSVDGKAKWSESTEYGCPLFITSIDQINPDQIALSFIRLGYNCPSESTATVQFSTDKLNWLNDIGGSASPRIRQVPQAKTYYRMFIGGEPLTLGTQVSNIVEFTPLS